MRYAIISVVALLLLAVVAGDTLVDVFPDATEEDMAKLSQFQTRSQQTVYIDPPMSHACPVLPTPAPTNSVYALKPGHIKVVMSMGDSITAAMSAKDTTVLSLKEYRGISFGIGCDPGVQTMPNILKSITGNNITGCSVGIGKRTSLTVTELNAAESGDINSDMITQADWLVKRLQTYPNISMANDWKLLTIWIGSNNLCDVCDNAVRNNAADFTKNLYSAIDILKKSVPKLFINLLQNLEITQIYAVKDGLCGTLHPIECGCAASSSAATRELVKQTAFEYQAAAKVIAEHYMSQKPTDFAIVAQPFLTNSTIFDRSYLSAADCFHPSAIAHSIASVALWNNMITPYAKKQTSWVKSPTIICPTTDTLLYTN